MSNTANSDMTSSSRPRVFFRPWFVDACTAQPPVRTPPFRLIQEAKEAVRRGGARMRTVASGVTLRLRAALARPAFPAIQHLAELGRRLRNQGARRLRNDVVAVGRVRRGVRIMHPSPGFRAAFTGDVITGEI